VTFLSENTLPSWTEQRDELNNSEMHLDTRARAPRLHADKMGKKATTRALERDGESAVTIADVSMVSHGARLAAVREGKGDICRSIGLTQVLTHLNKATNHNLFSEGACES
jgi:hypothetical protein